MTMHANDTIAKEILDSLNSDLADLNRMLDILSEERNCLENVDHSKLESYTEQKSELSRLLDNRAKQRTDKLNSMDLKCGNANEWKQTLAALNPSQYGSTITATWNKVEHALKQCNSAAQINEKIVASLLQSARQFIAALRGTDDSSKVYDASGRTTKNTGQLEFVQA